MTRSRFAWRFDVGDDRLPGWLGVLAHGAHHGPESGWHGTAWVMLDEYHEILGHGQRETVGVDKIVAAVRGAVAEPTRTLYRVELADPRYSRSTGFYHRAILQPTQAEPHDVGAALVSFVEHVKGGGEWRWVKLDPNPYRGKDATPYVLVYLKGGEPVGIVAPADPRRI